MSRRKPLTPRVDRLESRRLLAANPLMAWERPFALHFVDPDAGLKAATGTPIAGHRATPQALAFSGTARPEASGHLELQPAHRIHGKPAPPTSEIPTRVSGHLHLPSIPQGHTRPATGTAHAPGTTSNSSTGILVHAADASTPVISIATGTNPAIQGGNKGILVVSSSTTASLTVTVSITLTGPNAAYDAVIASYDRYATGFGQSSTGTMTGTVTLASADGVHPAFADLWVIPSLVAGTATGDDTVTASVVLPPPSGCCCVPPPYTVGSPNSAAVTIVNSVVGVSVATDGSLGPNQTSGGAPGVPATFHVTRYGDWSRSIAVQISGAGSTAVPGTDFTYTVTGGMLTLDSGDNGTLTIPGGTQDVAITVTPIDPTVTASKAIDLAAGPGYNSCYYYYNGPGFIQLGAASAALTIVPPQPATLTYDGVSVIGGHGTANLTIPNPPGFGSPALITWKIDGAEESQTFTKQTALTTDLPESFSVAYGGDSSASLPFFWNAYSRIHTINAEIDYSNGESLPATGLSIDVKEPVVSAMTVQLDPLQIGAFTGPDGESNTGLHMGDLFNANPNPGVILMSTVTTPNVAINGDYEFAYIHLLSNDTTIIGRTDNVPHVYNTNGTVLDDTPDAGIFLNGAVYPVPPNTPAQIGPGLDGPAVGGPAAEVGNPRDNYAQTIQIFDLFNTYLLFREPGGIWVGVADREWAILGKVHFDETQSAWVVDTPLSPSRAVTYSGTAENEFVNWNNYNTNFDFVPPYNP